MPRMVTASLFSLFVLLNHSTSARAVDFRGIPHNPLGNATLTLMGTPESGTLSVGSIGSSGMDGVAAELDDVCLYGARWNALPAPNPGELLRFRVEGSASGATDPVLAVMEFGQSGSGLDLAVELQDVGGFLSAVRIHLGPSLVYNELIADTGVFANVARWPDEVYVESACTDAILSAMTFRWNDPVWMSIADGPTVMATTVQIFASAFSGSFTSVELEAANVSPIVLTHAVSALSDTPVNHPSSARIELSSPVPNPFNPRTEIVFALTEPMTIRLDVLDIRGRLVKNLLQGHREAGSSSALWDGTDASGRAVGSGVYFVRLNSEEEVRIQKVALVR